MNTYLQMINRNDKEITELKETVRQFVIDENKTYENLVIALQEKDRLSSQLQKMKFRTRTNN